MHSGPLAMIPHFLASLQHVPDQGVDLVLLDTSTTAARPASVEWVIRKFLETESEPLIILVSNTKVSQMIHGQGKRGMVQQEGMAPVGISFILCPCT